MDFSNLKDQYKAYKKEIDKGVISVMSKSDFILGEEVLKFENEFKKYTKAKYAISCASGTDALLLALKACDIKNGDEVIVPTFTFIATASTVVLVGATPVFADVEENTFNIDPKDIKKKITKKTRAIIIVHLFGLPANMKEITKICKKHKLILIEDCAQAFGAKFKGKHVGTFGDVGCFSFFPAKNLGAYGDGGMITTGKRKIYEKLAMLRVHGSKKKYESKYIGLNSRLDTIQAAILSVKLKHFNKELKKRREVAKFYNKNLKSSLILSKPFEEKNYFHSFNYYTLRVKNRDKLQKYLKLKGIPTMVYYPVPCHMQDAMKYLKYKKGDFPISEKLVKEALSLPISGFISKSKLKYIKKSMIV